MTRYIAVLPTDEPLGGICPACDGYMDETGCRIGDHFVGTSASGISQVVEVFCEGTPTIAAQECPACR